MANGELTPIQRIQAAEAEEVEALRDILKAEARSASAEAAMMENLVEVNKTIGEGARSLFGQGPLAVGNPIPAWLAALLAEAGSEVAGDLVDDFLGWAKDLIGGTAEKQQGRAEQTKQSAAKEAVIKGNIEAGGDVIIQSGSTTGGGSSVGATSGSGVAPPTLP
jgi:hypothetical protein